MGAEPAALTEAELALPDDEVERLENRFKAAMVAWGRSCHDALGRVCGWHESMGYAPPPNLPCGRPDG